jgi:peroxiredoxin Q/BCP
MLFNKEKELSSKIIITMLKIGDKVPEFSVEDENGNVVTEKQLIGKKTVIYFYPKDSTPGCTAEACDLRDNYHAFLAQGYQIYGVSKDSKISHQKFKAKYDLPFPLLSDPTTVMLQAFGAWGEKKMYGKTTMGTLRKTFVFDEKGVLQKIIEKVDTKNHSAQLL